jgi:acetyl/propionyl-CoA carboxylase alpha subunit
MAIVNDRITRFVRDNDLPIVCFGFGDCTGGAQASLVTHPLVLTYYFSGTNMPFAGQIVVPSYLPLTATMSNYLSVVPGAMHGLVEHPFAKDMDKELREVDPNVPLAIETVQDVIGQVLRGDVNYDDSAEGLESGTFLRPSRKKKRPIKRCLIHARGCTAVKLIRIAQKKGIPVVLVQSDADMESVAAEMLGENDKLVCLGGNTPDESYLNAHSIIRIAGIEECDALHPGIGFLSENAQFAGLCRNHGINVVGPTVHSMEMMGNKSNAIQTSQRLKVPVVPGSHGIVTTAEAAKGVADTITYPVIIKAVHGGGGKGIQVVEDPDKFTELWARIGAEAKSAFGNGDCYIEKYITALRHVEIQILRDQYGNTRVLGLRDCSVQRNNQKIIEESGSTLLNDELRDAMFDYAAAIADEVRYFGAGTVEFIFDLEAQAVYFMEMNTRLQVEHPVTEKVTGTDIVSRQFDIAAGERIQDMEIKESGYAMEVRINAESTERDADGSIIFIPDPGTITKCVFPDVDHIDIIATIAEGKVISPFYDNMVAQIICSGKDRKDATRKLVKYLDSVVIQGVCTNIALLKRILTDKVFVSGKYDTRYLPRFLERTDIDTLIEEINEAAGLSRESLDRSAIEIEYSDEIKVIAPSTGIFYTAPTPADPEFVAVGEKINTEQTLCLIEAMKLFRPISLDFFNQTGELYPADQAYEVVRVNPSNGQAVNKGDLLFVIRPV